MEPRGVEPLSENMSTGTSPGAEGYLRSLAEAQTFMLDGLVASDAWRAQSFARSRSPLFDAPHPDRGPSGGDAHCLGSEKNSIVIVLLFISANF